MAGDTTNRRAAAKAVAAL
jgi:hypothetical protein